MKSLVIGTGLIGSQIANQLGCDTAGRHGNTHYMTMEECVVKAPDFLTAVVGGECYETVFNCAGRSGYGVCEQDPSAYVVNVDAPIAISRALGLSQLFVHLSSDSVTFALNTAYGMQKALAEIALVQMGVLVVRLRKTDRHNVELVANEIIRLAQERRRGLVIL